METAALKLDNTTAILATIQGTEYIAAAQVTQLLEAKKGKLFMRYQLAHNGRLTTEYPATVIQAVVFKHKVNTVYPIWFLLDDGQKWIVMDDDGIDL